MNFTIFLFLIACCLKLAASGHHVITNVHHTVADATHGTWKKKWSWKQRWVKTWKPKTVYVAHWTRVWTPAETREYIPMPPIPPNWKKPTTHY